MLFIFLSHWWCVWSSNNYIQSFYQQNGNQKCISFEQSMLFWIIQESYLTAWLENFYPYEKLVIFAFRIVNRCGKSSRKIHCLFLDKMIKFWRKCITMRFQRFPYLERRALITSCSIPLYFTRDIIKLLGKVFEIFSRLLLDFFTNEWSINL